jgi:hypothetical protein
MVHVNQNKPQQYKPRNSVYEKKLWHNTTQPPVHNIKEEEIMYLKVNMTMPLWQLIYAELTGTQQKGGGIHVPEN